MLELNEEQRVLYCKKLDEMAEEAGLKADVDNEISHYLRYIKSNDN